ncbi:conjugal transfer protein [Streptomyces sp. NEAU-S7GS2]|uniref:conjugal transfer protein n=1 Tax=Streptomyces sp. NEAU-S7GS2 TaxID=2202000 RepID=UPI0013A5568F|nr:conjugal transfer protein [Streptomyces sp. NEAU-S7GS2]
MRPLRHRQVALVRAAALVALTCGPLALVALWSSPSPAAHPSGKAAHHSARPAAPADPGGFAEVFVGVWLQGGPSGGQESAALKAVRSMAPEVALPEFEGRPPKVGQVRAVRSVPVRPGAWSVTVAAVLEPGGKQQSVRYFRVPVLFSSDRGQDGGQSFVVTAAPAQTPGPSVRKAPATPHKAEVAPGSALSTTVSQFLTAYLGGAGGAERYLAPHVGLPSLGSSYAAVRTEHVTSTGSADGAVGKNGQRVRVLAQVSARDAHGAQWPLTYALRLAARDGRWEVLALESGLEDVKDTSSRDGA